MSDPTTSTAPAPKKMPKLTAIKTYFQRADNLAPTGGRPMATAEFKGIPPAELALMGQAAAALLGVEVE